MEQELYEWTLSNGNKDIQRDIVNNIYQSIDEAESQLNLKLTASEQTVPRTASSIKFMGKKRKQGNQIWKKQSKNIQSSKSRPELSLLESQYESFDQKASLGFIRETLKKSSQAVFQSYSQIEDLELNSERDKTAQSLYELFHLLIVTISDFKAGVLPITRVIGFQRKHKLEEF